MGFSEKPQVVNGGGLESSSSSKWVIAGISLRAPLKPIDTVALEKSRHDVIETEECLRTPTGEETRIPTISTCPAAPKKPKPKPKPKPRPASLKCSYNNKFFSTPTDLETVFIRH